MSLANAPSPQKAEHVFTTSTTVPLTTPSPPTSTSATSASKAASPVASSSLAHSSPSPAPAASSQSLHTAHSRPSPTSIAAAEYRNAHRWDACVENTLVKTGYGLLVGGGIALLLFRSPASRSAVAAMGGGFGAGMSWVECKQSFAAANAPVRPSLSTLQLPTIPSVSQPSQQAASGSSSSKTERAA